MNTSQQNSEQTWKQDTRKKRKSLTCLCVVESTVFVQQSLQSGVSVLVIRVIVVRVIQRTAAHYEQHLL